MTIFELIEENVFSLLDSAFMKDKECERLSSEIRELGKSNGEIQDQLSDDDSVFGEYVELINQRCARMTEIAYKRGIKDVINFLYKGKRQEAQGNK